jgi:hypothetical protein
MPQGQPEHQHVVSQILLRRFADSQSGLISAYDLNDGVERLLPPSSLGVVRRFIRKNPKEAEALWQQTESNLTEAFAAIDERTVFDQPAVLEVLRDAIALHWARSKTVMAVLEQSQERVRKLRRQGLAEKPEVLAAAYRDYFRVEPHGPADLEKIADLIHEQALAQLRAEDFFGERVIENFHESRERTRRHAVQIGIPEVGEFAIGDSPVVAWRAGHAGLGPLGGVPWSSADAILLPLGPGHCASLASEGGWISIPGHSVDRLNADQARHAFRHVYYRPGSGLGMCMDNARTQRS